MKGKLVILFLVLALPAFSLNQEVIIQGTFRGAEGETIRLMETLDYISNQKNEIDACRIDEEGNFEFTFRLLEPRAFFFRVFHGTNSFFAEPGKTYHVEFEPIDREGEEEGRDYYPFSRYYNFEIRQKGEGKDLNKLIYSLDDMVFDFVEENVSGQIRVNHRPALDNFRKHTDSVFEHVNHEFFRDYYEYSFASLNRALNARRFEWLADSFLIDRPVLYQNPAYMDFFSRMFNTFLFAASPNLSMNDLEISVNRHNSYHALMDSLGKEPVLRNELFRELVMIDGLKKMYDHPDFQPSNVVNILEIVKINSKFPQHRKIAANVLESLRQLRRGHPAPTLEVMDKQGNPVTLDTHLGKYVFLFFWASWCQSCLGELGPLNDMAEELSEKVEFIGIMVDRDPEAARVLTENEDLHFSVYHFNNDYRMLDRFGLRSVPAYIVIDPEGNILRNPFTAPSDEGKQRLQSLIRRTGGL